MFSNRFFTPLFAIRMIEALLIGASPSFALANVVSIDVGLSFTGDPGTTINYLPYPSLGFFESFVRSDFETPITINSGLDGGVAITDQPGYLTLNFNDGSSSAMASAQPGLYVQNLKGSGTFQVLDAAYNLVASGSLSDGTIFATPGTSSAEIYLYLPRLYALVFSGTSSTPVSLTASNPGCFPGMAGACVEPYFTQFDLDWTATIESTANSPGGVPELETWAMMLVGFASLGYLAYRASRKATPIAF
jgi:hypothetical protein